MSFASWQEQNAYKMKKENKWWFMMHLEYEEMKEANKNPTRREDNKHDVGAKINMD
jgi:hypothetical protein